MTICSRLMTLVCLIILCNISAKNAIGTDILYIMWVFLNCTCLSYLKKNMLKQTFQWFQTRILKTLHSLQNQVLANICRKYQVKLQIIIYVSIKLLGLCKFKKDKNSCASAHYNLPFTLAFDRMFVLYYLLLKVNTNI